MTDVSVARYRSGVSRIEQSRLPLNALDYGHTVEVGVFAIQSLAIGSSISTALPLHIYVPAGPHTLNTPITITRHADCRRWGTDHSASESSSYYL